MLRDEIALYTKLSGNDGEHTAIGIIGAYLDGYEKGKNDRPQGKWKKIGKEYYNWSNHDTIRCNRCKFEKDIPSGCHMPNYCESCGAEMRVKGGRE